MKKDLQGFSNANPDTLKAVVEFIEGYIGKEEVIERMKKGLLGFSRLKLDQLKQKEKEWGKQKMKGLLERYNLRNPVFSDKKQA